MYVPTEIHTPPHTPTPPEKNPHIQILHYSFKKKRKKVNILNTVFIILFGQNLLAMLKHYL